jgi:hypothetical protein
VPDRGCGDGDADSRAVSEKCASLVQRVCMGNGSDALLRSVVEGIVRLYTSTAPGTSLSVAWCHRGYTSIRRVWCDAEALAEVDAELGKETNASELLEAQVRQPVTSSESPQALLLYQCAS